MTIKESIEGFENAYKVFQGAVAERLDQLTRGLKEGDYYDIRFEDYRLLVSQHGILQKPTPSRYAGASGLPKTMTGSEVVRELNCRELRSLADEIKYNPPTRDSGDIANLQRF